MKYYLFIGLLSLCANIGLSQEIQPLWHVTDTTQGSLGARPLPIVLVDSSQNVILCGETYAPGPATGFFTVKYDSDGNRLWDQYHDTFGLDGITAAVTDEAGSVYVGGYTLDPFTFKTKFIVFKYSVDGDSIWQYSNFDFDPDAVTNLVSMLLTPDQKIVVLGYFSNSATPNAGMMAIVLDTVGNKIWEAEYSEGKYYGYTPLGAKLLSDRIFIWGTHGSDEGSRFFSWQLDYSGELIQTVETSPYTDDFEYYYHIDKGCNLYIGDRFGEYKVTKYTADGNLEWQYNKPVADNPNGIEARLTTIETDDEGSVYIGGSYYIDSIGYFVALHSKLSSSGELIWEDVLEVDSVVLATPLKARWITDDLLLFTGSYRTIASINEYQPYLSAYTSEGLYYSSPAPLPGINNAPKALNSNASHFYMGGKFTAPPLLDTGSFLAKYDLNTVGLQTPNFFPEPLYLSVSPNPTSNTFLIHFTNADFAKSGILRINDLDGKLISESQIDLAPGENSIQVDVLRSEKPGVYLVSFQVGGELYSAKVIRG